MKRVFILLFFLVGIYFSKSTSQESYQFILYENFESIIPPSVPAGWTTIDENGDGRTWQTRKFGGNTTNPQCIRYSSNNIVAANDWFFSSEVQLDAGTQYTITFKYKVSQAAVHKMDIWIGNSPMPGGMTNKIFSNTSLNQTIMTEISTNFSTSASGMYYFGFHCYSDANNGLLNVDEIIISQPFSDLQLSFVLTKFLLNRGATPVYNLSDTLEGQILLNNIGTNVLFINKNFNVGHSYALETNISYIVIDPDGDTLDYILKAEPYPWPTENSFLEFFPGDVTGRIDDLQELFWFTKPGVYTVRALYQNYYQSNSNDAWLGKVYSIPVTFIMQ